MTDETRRGGMRAKLHEVIFEADTRAGKLFDLALIWCILLSVLAVMLDSVRSIHAAHGRFLIGVEWFFTIVFTVEYILRLSCIGRPARYAKSFFGVIDLLSVIPTYLSLLLPGSQYLLVIRILRVLRIFRVLKLARFLHEANAMVRALRASSRKIVVFFSAILAMVVIFGSIMYLVEGEANGFTSIPRSVYWAIVTMTTVGYGDISPQTALGQAIAAALMILGFAIIAVPTGIVATELSRAEGTEVSTQACPQCGAEGHEQGAKYCKECGAAL
ncbi:MAG: ion transporter [Candidatus Eisenbacteria bacterium]|nr:ion transporter [Candidatus Eisenbacteria bacterium]